MNQKKLDSTPRSNLTFNINSKLFLDRLENDILQLVKTLIVEHQISVDNAKAMARRMIQNKVNQMLTEEEKKGIEELSKETNDIITAPQGTLTANFRIHARKVYELLKIMGFK